MILGKLDYVLTVTSVKVPTRRERMSGKRSAIYDLR